ncbi:hypothetical protein AAMO2058_000171700 [Amorphochlora amoebiformis]
MNFVKREVMPRYGMANIFEILDTVKGLSDRAQKGATKRKKAPIYFVNKGVKDDSHDNVNTQQDKAEDKDWIRYGKCVGRDIIRVESVGFEVRGPIACKDKSVDSMPDTFPRFNSLQTFIGGSIGSLLKAQENRSLKCRSDTSVKVVISPSGRISPLPKEYLG